MNSCEAYQPFGEEAVWRVDEDVIAAQSRGASRQDKHSKSEVGWDVVRTRKQTMAAPKSDTTLRHGLVSCSSQHHLNVVQDLHCCLS